MSNEDVVKNALQDIKDAASETRHRILAKAEEVKRDVGKDSMNPVESLRSVGNQAKHEAQAEMDRAKRVVRGVEEDADSAP